MHATLGAIGLGWAGYLVSLKAILLMAGNPHVFGIGAVANLALVFGSLMFLRNARYFHKRAESLLRSGDDV